MTIFYKIYPTVYDSHDGFRAPFSTEKIGVESEQEGKCLAESALRCAIKASKWCRSMAASIRIGEIELIGTVSPDDSIKWTRYVPR